MASTRLLRQLLVNGHDRCEWRLRRTPTRDSAWSCLRKWKLADYQVLILPSGCVRHCAIMILWMDSVVRAPRESPEGDPDPSSSRCPPFLTLCRFLCVRVTRLMCVRQARLQLLPAFGLCTSLRHPFFTRWAVPCVQDRVQSTHSNRARYTVLLPASGHPFRHLPPGTRLRAPATGHASIDPLAECGQMPRVMFGPCAPRSSSLCLEQREGCQVWSDAHFRWGTV